MAQGFPIAAIEGEGDAHLCGIVAADPEAVRAPAQIGSVNGNAPVVATFDAADMSLEKEAMDFTAR